MSYALENTFRTGRQISMQRPIRRPARPLAECAIFPDDYLICNIWETSDKIVDVNRMVPQGEGAPRIGFDIKSARIR